MKKHLLITLGDSWTVGVGCGTSALGIRLPQTFSSEEDYTTYVTEINKRQDMYGWSRLCANLLDYDLINLSMAGWSNSGLVKKVISDIQNTTYKTIYEKVVFVYLLTDPYRFGVFTNKGITNISPRGLKSIDNTLYLPKKEALEIPVGTDEVIWESYINNMIPEGAVSETIFSLICMEHFCKSCGYDFYWGTAFTPHQELSIYSKVNNCLHYNEFDDFRSMILKKCGLKGFSSCKHPNELGYQEMANYIFNKLSL